MRKRKRKLDLNRVVVKPLDDNSLVQVTGGGKQGNTTLICHDNSIIPTNRNCCW